MDLDTLIHTACVGYVELFLISIASSAEVSKTAGHTHTAAVVAMTGRPGLVQHCGVKTVHRGPGIFHSCAHGFCVRLSSICS